MGSTHESDFQWSPDKKNKRIKILEIHACSNPSPLFPNIVST